MITSLNGTRFGNIEYANDDVVTFPEGLIGFEALKGFLLVAHKPESPFRWLQSIEEPAVAFLVAEPRAYVADYEASIRQEDAEALALSADTQHAVLSTVSIRSGGEEMTLNLLAPIVLNLEARIGKQVVLEGDAYNIRHRVFPQANPSERIAA